jgi:hypothetical protein
MSWLSSLFSGGNNPADAAMPYLDKIPGETKPYLDPFFEAGKNVLPDLTKQYGLLTSDPGALMNKLGASYQQSPGFQQALKEALTAGSHAAAAGGMAGTPAHQFTSMDTATGLANKDYNDWLSKVLGMYGTGISGEQDMSHQGLQAGTSLADIIAQTLSQQAGYSYAGQAAKNQNANSLLSGAFKLAGSAIPYFM